MLTIDNTHISGIAAAISGLRNPMESWDKSDSFANFDGSFEIGPVDHALAMRMANGGPEEYKFLRYFNVTMRINAPLYWWKEFDTYKIGTVSNSCSTMHKIQKHEFTPNMFSHEHLDWFGRLKLNIDCHILNHYRKKFNKTLDKKYWWQLIQNLSTSYNQLRTIQLNYAVLKNIYSQRKNHKLDEWRTFCEWIENLPYAELIIGDNNA